MTDRHRGERDRYGVLGESARGGRESLHSFRPGDRVARRYDGKIGAVHAVYPADLEDDTEVKFTNGTWTCSNHTKFQKIGGSK